MRWVGKSGRMGCLETGVVGGGGLGEEQWAGMGNGERGEGWLGGWDAVWKERRGDGKGNGDGMGCFGKEGVWGPEACCSPDREDREARAKVALWVHEATAHVL